MAKAGPWGEVWEGIGQQDGPGDRLERMFFRSAREKLCSENSTASGTRTSEGPLGSSVVPVEDCLEGALCPLPHLASTVGPHLSVLVPLDVPGDDKQKELTVLPRQRNKTPRSPSST